MADYALKVKSVPDHPSVSTLENCWQSHYANYQRVGNHSELKRKKILAESESFHVPSAPPIPAPWVKCAWSLNYKYLQPFKKDIRDSITDQWQELWDYSDTGQFYRDLRPVVGYRIKRVVRPRPKDVQITRLRLGHVRLGEKLHTIGKRPDPYGVVCREPEDVEHFLLECTTITASQVVPLLQ